MHRTAFLFGVILEFVGRFPWPSRAVVYKAHKDSDTKQITILFMMRLMLYGFCSAPRWWHGHFNAIRRTKKWILPCINGRSKSTKWKNKQHMRGDDWRQGKVQSCRSFKDCTVIIGADETHKNWRCPPVTKSHFLCQCVACHFTYLHPEDREFTMVWSILLPICTDSGGVLATDRSITVALWLCTRFWTYVPDLGGRTTKNQCLFPLLWGRENQRSGEEVSTSYAAMAADSQAGGLGQNGKGRSELVSEVSPHQNYCRIQQSKIWIEHPFSIFKTFRWLVVSFSDVIYIYI